MTTVVVSPHPDDEVLGAGGTIARLAREGGHVEVVIVTRGDGELFDPELVERGRAEARQAHATLGVERTHFLAGFPAAKLDTVPQHRLNDRLREVFAAVQPDTVFVPFPDDIHRDHAAVAEAALVAARPLPGASVREVLAYETLSETNWNAPGASHAFRPNVYVDITETLELKLDALREFRSQLHEFPHERSLDAVMHLARHRGATVGLSASEAFMLMRQVR